jgi:hypothetical protein
MEPGLQILIHPIYALAVIPYSLIIHKLIIEPALPRPALQCTAIPPSFSLSTNLRNFETRFYMIKLNPYIIWS